MPQVYQKALNHLKSISDPSSAKFKDLQDMCLYYLNYLEESAVNTEALIDLSNIKTSLMDQGCLSEKLTGSSAISGLIEKIS